MATVSDEAAPTAVPVGGVPLATPAVAPIDLSVVVVFYNMRREAARTLHSLSRAYQEGIDDLDYEVIVVENGSDARPAARRGVRRRVRSRVPLRRHGDDAHPSPVAALNGASPSPRGDAVALMIDGAHVLTPGVLRYGLAGSATYAPAIVSTQQWYVGPGQQGDAIDDGYDQAYEDRLFDGDRAGRRRLSPVRDRPLHRRPRLARRVVGEQLHLRVARSQLEQVGALRRGRSPCPAVATPTSSCTNVSGHPPTSPWRRSSARDRSTRCTAAPPPTRPDPAERRARVVRLRRALRRAARPGPQGTR